MKSEKIHGTKIWLQFAKIGKAMHSRNLTSKNYQDHIIYIIRMHKKNRVTSGRLADQNWVY